MAFIITDECVSCGRCIHICPEHAICPGEEIARIDPEKCVSCGACGKICPTGCIYDAELPPAPPISHGLIERDCDLVVLGGGGSGMVAAARAAELTGKKVIVLEKMKRIGGGAWFAADFKIFNSKWQKDRGIPDICNESMLAAMDLTYWKLNPHLVANCFKATGEFFDWLCELDDGVAEQFTEGSYIFDGPNGPKIPVFKRERQGAQGGTGQLVMEMMLEHCQKQGVEILTGHRAVDFVMENGKITAVIAEDPGGQTKINCKACVLATGSWINNQEILEKYTPKFAKIPMGRSPHRHVAYTGDGIALAEKAGAFVDYDSFCLRLMGPLVMDPSQTIMSITNDPSIIFVNKNGKRWINEQSRKRMGVFDAAVPLLDQPDGVSYALFNESILESAVEKSKDIETDKFDFFGPSKCPDNYHEDLENALNRPGTPLYKADTVEDLARQIGINPDALAETVEHHNETCLNGRDDYFKRPDEMVPLSKPPYYAVRCEMGTDGAFGGVLINKDIQAYGKNGVLVEGLYVAGDFSSGRFINLGGIKRQIINDLAWAFSSGFIAAASAAQYLLSNGKTDTVV